MQIIPFTNEPIQKFNTQLDNAIYIFRVLYNSRGDYWTIDIHDANDNLLAAGIKLVLGANLVKAYRLNITALIAVNNSDNQKDPGSEAILGTDVFIYYLNNADIIAFRSSLT
jgi:hypothetical protein